jgi:ribosomal protein RSM22 (predicted rRNA methylase)
MNLPYHLQDKIDQILQKSSSNTLKMAREALSSTYREGKTSKSIFSDEAKRLAYLATRLPATFAAVSAVIEQILKQVPNFLCSSFLDLGAGPGTATLAALEYFPSLPQITLIEKSHEAITLGKMLINSAKWICQDLKETKDFPKADLAILSYSLGEIKGFMPILEKLWNSSINTIAIIEPGTPAGYKTILEARDFFLKQGASILAPCPHSFACPLKAGDWCHFGVRLERTKLHKLLKEGSLGYEDEKFSYLVITKTKNEQNRYSRILRHPHKGSGHVKLTLCMDDGTFAEKIVSRKHNELYRESRDSSWGDAIQNLEEI